MTKKRLARILIVAIPILAFLVGILVARLGQPQTVLLARFDPTAMDAGYFWDSPSGGALFTASGKYEQQPDIRSKPFGRSGNYSALARDLSGRNASLLDMRESPNRRYVVTDGDAGWVLAKPDGSFSRTIPLDDDSMGDAGSIPTWLPDSQQFADLSTAAIDGVLHVYNVHDDGNRLLRYPALPAAEGMAAGVTPTGQGVLAVTMDGKSPIAIATVTLKEPVHTTVHAWDSQPNDDRPGYAGVALSPDGKVIAWLVNECPHGYVGPGDIGGHPEDPWMDRMLRRFWYVKHVTLWVSNRDGTGARCIGVLHGYNADTGNMTGYQTRPMMTNYDLEDTLTDLQWCPDNKRVSWLADGGLWAMKVR